MAVPQTGARVHVAVEALNEVTCEFLPRIAGKTGYAAHIDILAGEAFVVARPGDVDGSYVPLKFITLAE